MINKYKELLKENKVSWIILGVLTFIYFFTMYYVDMETTYLHSMSFVDCLINGNLFNFYNYSIEHQYGGLPATYFIPSYAVFAIWNLPNWIVSRLFDINPSSVGCLLWTKAILIPFTILTVREFVLILRNIEDKDVEYKAFNLCSSLFFFLPLWAVAQYDIIELFFMLWGLRIFLENRGMNLKCMLIFSVGISFKAYAVFVYVILLLVSEKRIWFILRDLLVGASFSIVTLLPFIRGFFSASSSCNQNFLDSWTALKIHVGDGFDISVFLLVTIFVMLVAYFYDKYDVRIILFLIATFWCSFFILTETNPYWLVLLIPFLLFIIDSKKIRYAYIFEIIAEIAMVCVQMNAKPWVFGGETSFSYLCLKGLSRKPGNIISIYGRALEYTLIGKGKEVLFTLFVAIMVGLLALSIYKVKDDRVGTSENVIESEVIVRIIRLVMLVCFFIVTMWNACLI